MIANIPAAVLAHLQTWATVPIAQPDKPIDRPEPPSPWLLVEFLGADSSQSGFGAPGRNLFTATASIWIHVIAPMPGEPTAWEMACEIESLFRGQILGDAEDIRIGDIAISGGETADKGIWWRRTVAITIETDDEG